MALLKHDEVVTGLRRQKTLEDKQFLSLENAKFKKNPGWLIMGRSSTCTRAPIRVDKHILEHTAPIYTIRPKDTSSTFQPLTNHFVSNILTSSSPAMSGNQSFKTSPYCIQFTDVETEVQILAARSSSRLSHKTVHPDLWPRMQS